MADDLQERLHAALAVEAEAERNVTKIRERIAIAKAAADRARDERQSAAELVANGETVNLASIIQKLMHAEAEVELLAESVILAEQRLAQTLGGTEAVLTGFARRVPPQRRRFTNAPALRSKPRRRRTRSLFMP